MLTHPAGTHFTPRSKHHCTSRFQVKSRHGQWAAASGYSSIPQGQDIPGCVSSPSCPQGLEIAMTSSSQEHPHSHQGGVIPRNIRTIPGGSWHGKGREGTIPSSPTRLDFPHGISLLQTSPATEDLLQPFLGKHHVGNAPADTSECPGCAACHASSYFRKGDGNKWEDKVPLV